MLFRSDEDIYKVSYDMNLNLHNHYTKDMIPFMNNDKIKKISANNNCVWFSTSLGRLFRLDLTDQKISEVTDVCSLEGNNILKLLSTANKLWIISDKSIVCHDHNQNENIIYSVNDDNIFVSSFRHSAAFIDEKECLYAGGHNGFIKISQNE